MASSRIIESQTFKDYPDAVRFMELHKSRDKCCLVTNCNDGFIVDIYQEKRFEHKEH